MQLRIKKYLYDIHEACELLEQFTRGKTFQEYTADALLRSGVERQFEIIGEALSQMLRLEPALESEVPSSKRIVAFRNRLIHGYANIAHDVVWGILQDSLPRLRADIERLLAAS